MFDPRIGRWLSEDPIGFRAGDPNLYRYAGNAFPNRTDPSGLLECDDRENAPGNARLRNVHEQLAAHVNSVIRTARADARNAGENATAFVGRVYRALGQDVPGTGVYSTLVGSVAQVTEIEFWLATNLTVGANQINWLKFSESRYRDNEITRWNAFNLLNGVLWFFDEETAEHGLAPTIRINDTLMGTDKWGHFFQQGYYVWYWTRTAIRVTEPVEGRSRWFSLTDDAMRQRFCDWMEGDYQSRPRVVRGQASGAWGGMTIYELDEIDAFPRMLQTPPSLVSFGGGNGCLGERASGVISHADKKANMAGYRFYEALYQDYASGRHSFTFSVGNYNTREFNEAVVTPNTFSRGVIVNDTANPAATVRRTPPRMVRQDRPTPGLGERLGDAMSQAVQRGTPPVCFVAGTLVHTRRGLVRIEEIALDDQVKSWNERTGRFEVQPIVRLISAEKYELIVVEGASWSLRCSPEHPFLLSDHRWRLATELVEGDLIMTLKGSPSRIRSVNKVRVSEGVRVYNFRVQSTHTYCVTEAALVVHNK